MFYRISLAACVLALFVIVLGAYVRLSDAGLGCPDWPGCYGQITAPDEAAELLEAQRNYPHLEVHSGKAWKEMAHRYFASTLGLLIVAMAFMAWRRRASDNQAVALPLFLVLLVIFQGLLGMWTVTLLLKPTIVTLHLITGLLTLSLLFWVMLQHRRPWHVEFSSIQVSPVLKYWGRLALCVLAFQIFLGGWTSTNYAALYCIDFPTCQGSWWPETDFSQAYIFINEIGVNYEGGLLTQEAGVTVHFMHRLGALVTFVVLLGFAFRLYFQSHSLYLRRLAIAIAAVLFTQVSLGIANVLLLLPIPVAVGHNAVAAVLLLHLVFANYAINQQQSKRVKHE